MKSMIWSVFLIFSLLFLLALGPHPAAAHGIGHRILNPESAIAVEFVYSDNEPIRYAEVLVFSPENDEIEYQNGRTDMNGRFVFYPNAPGQWRIQANDGTGHLVKAVVDIEKGNHGDTRLDGIADDHSEAHGHDHSHDRLPRLWAIILGISLIANMFLAFYLSKARKK